MQGFANINSGLAPRAGRQDSQWPSSGLRQGSLPPSVRGPLTLCKIRKGAIRHTRQLPTGDGGQYKEGL